MLSFSRAVYRRFGRRHPVSHCSPADIAVNRIRTQREIVSATSAEAAQCGSAAIRAAPSSGARGLSARFTGIELIHVANLPLSQNARTHVPSARLAGSL